MMNFCLTIVQETQNQQNEVIENCENIIKNIPESEKEKFQQDQKELCQKLEEQKRINEEKGKKMLRQRIVMMKCIEYQSFFDYKKNVSKTFEQNIVDVIFEAVYNVLKGNLLYDDVDFEKEDQFVVNQRVILRNIKNPQNKDESEQKNQNQHKPQYLTQSQFNLERQKQFQQSKQLDSTIPKYDNKARQKTNELLASLPLTYAGMHTKMDFNINKKVHEQSQQFEDKNKQNLNDVSEIKIKKTIPSQSVIIKDVSQQLKQQLKLKQMMESTYRSNKTTSIYNQQYSPKKGSSQNLSTNKSNNNNNKIKAQFNNQDTNSQNGTPSVQFLSKQQSKDYQYQENRQQNNNNDQQQQQDQNKIQKSNNLENNEEDQNNQSHKPSKFEIQHKKIFNNNLNQKAQLSNKNSDTNERYSSNNNSVSQNYPNHSKITQKQMMEKQINQQNLRNQISSISIELQKSKKQNFKVPNKIILSTSLVRKLDPKIEQNQKMTQSQSNLQQISNKNIQFSNGIFYQPHNKFNRQQKQYNSTLNNFYINQSYKGSKSKLGHSTVDTTQVGQNYSKNTLNNNNSKEFSQKNLEQSQVVQQDILQSYYKENQQKNQNQVVSKNYSQIDLNKSQENNIFQKIKKREKQMQKQERQLKKKLFQMQKKDNQDLLISAYKQ